MATTVNLTSVYNEGENKVAQFLISTDVLDTPQTICGTPDETFTAGGVTYLLNINAYQWRIQGLVINATSATVVKVYSGSTLLGEFPIGAGGAVTVQGLVATHKGDLLRLETDVAITNAVLSLVLRRFE